MWTRTGHAVQQEFKTAVLDFLDVLACPTDEYVGFETTAATTLASSSSSTGVRFVDGVKIENKATNGSSVIVVDPVEATIPKVDVLFKLDDDKKKEMLPIDNDVNKVEYDINFSNKNDVDNKDDNVRNTSPYKTFSSKKVSVLEEEVKKSIVEVNNVTNKPIVMQQLTQPRPVLPSSTSTSTTNAILNLKSIIKNVQNENIKQKTMQKATTTTTATTTTNALVEQKSLIQNIIEGNQITNISDDKQKANKAWIVDDVPGLSSTFELEKELELKRKEYLDLLEKEKQKNLVNANLYKEKLELEQEKRRKKFEEEDKKMLLKLQNELETRQKERDFIEKQRRLEMQEIEINLVSTGLIPPYNNQNTTNKLTTTREPVLELTPINYEAPTSLPTIVTEGRDVISKLDRMLLDEEEARKRGIMNIADYEIIKQQIAERQMQREQKLRHLSDGEKARLFVECAIEIQKSIRKFIAIRKVTRLSRLRAEQKKNAKSATKIQSLFRGVMGRKKFLIYKRNFLLNVKHSYSVTEIQRVARGYIDRKFFMKLKKNKKCIQIQKNFRGFLGRLVYKQEKKRLALLKKKQFSAAKIQSIWRMKVAKEEFRSIRIHTLATIEIQRMYRGYLGRKKCHENVNGKQLHQVQNESNSVCNLSKKVKLRLNDSKKK